MFRKPMAAWQAARTVLSRADDRHGPWRSQR